MPAEWRKIRSNIEMWAEDAPILLMVSGGLDSMFLLDFMSRSKVDFDVIHFQHHIRDDDIEDFRLVAHAVGKINLKRAAEGKKYITIFRGHGENLKGITNQEAEAHKQRWEYAESVAREIRNNWMRDNLPRGDERNNETTYRAMNSCPLPIIITAHHHNDHVEHVLMKLVRGTPHDQLKWRKMHYFPDHYRFKPLLEVDKSEILNQAIIRGVEWREDETNQYNHLERNHMRNVILPELMKFRNVFEAMRDTLKEP